MSMLLCLGCISEFYIAVSTAGLNTNMYTKKPKQRTTIKTTNKQKNTVEGWFCKKRFAMRKPAGNYKRRMQTNGWKWSSYKNDPESILVDTTWGDDVGISVEDSCFLSRLWSFAAVPAVSDDTKTLMLVSLAWILYKYSPATCDLTVGYCMEHGP